MSTLVTMLLADAVEKGDWITVEGRHIFIASPAGAKASKDAWDSSKKVKNQSTAWAASVLHAKARDLLKTQAKKATGSEKKSLLAQSAVHQDESLRLYSKGFSLTPTHAEPVNVKGAADKKLMSIATTAGKTLYGGSLRMGPEVNRYKDITAYAKATENDDAKHYDVYDFRFNPSTGKAYQSDGQLIRASHADVDGKIYIGS